MTPSQLPVDTHYRRGYSITMTKKAPIVATLLQTAPVVVVDAPKPAPAIAEVAKRSPYEELFASLPGDPAQKAWLMDQIEVSKSWGEEVLHISSVTLIALLDRALTK